MMTIKIFGERNTGTTALAKMLTGVENCRVLGGRPEEVEPQVFKRFEPSFAIFERRWRRFYRDAVSEYALESAPPLFAWKHASPKFVPDYDDPTIAVVMMVKHPFSWLVSLWNRPYGIFGPKSPTLEHFVDRPWKTLRCEGEPALLPSPVELWNRKLRAYAAFIDAARDSTCQVITLPFENFIRDPAAECRFILDHFGLEQTEPRPLERSTKSKRHCARDIQDYYENEDWREAISEEAWRRIDDQVDWRIAERFGYGRPEFDPGRRTIFHRISDYAPRRWRRH